MRQSEHRQSDNRVVVAPELTGAGPPDALQLNREVKVMARPKKIGLDYFPFDVDFFEDKAVKVLKGRFGSDGIVLYIYLLCTVYSDKGYYTKVDDDFNYVVSSDLGMNSEKTGLIMKFLCERSMLEGQLLVSDNVITSHGIQARFQEAKKMSRTDVEVEQKYWVLEKNETLPFIKFTQNPNYYSNNPSFYGKNPPLTPKKCHKEKESKVKESKGKERKEKTELIPNNSQAENSVQNSSALSAALNYYEKNIPGKINSQIQQAISDWTVKADISLIEYAIDQAVEYNKRSWAYVSSVLKSHYAQGHIDRKSAEAGSRKGGTNGFKKNNFNGYDGSYGQTDIEKQLLKKRMDKAKGGTDE